MTRWQYCQSCMHTVQVYANKAAVKLQKLKDEALKAKKSASEIRNQSVPVIPANEVCNDDLFGHYLPVLSQGCKQILTEHPDDFHQPFVKLAPYETSQILSLRQISELRLDVCCPMFMTVPLLTHSNHVLYGVPRCAPLNWIFAHWSTSIMGV